MATVLTGLPQVLARLETAVAAMAGPAAEATVQSVANDAADKARSLAPVDTGKLRDSIHVEGEGPGADVVVSVDYAASIEYGSSHNDPQPFLRPAVHQAEAELPAKAAVIYRSTVPFLS
jgi:HK97 gp10 family phage protein